MGIKEFERDFQLLSQFGGTGGGGVDRQAATESHVQASEWFAQWLRARSFTTKVDGIGNIFGLLEWRPGAPFVLIGSHLDSQPRAGKYDGAYGVLAAMHAADEIRRKVDETAEIPAFNLGVVSWFNEEGSRFKPSMMGSGVFAGHRSLQRCLAITDPDGTTVAAALQKAGMAGRDTAPDAVAYAEIHIEQGRKLDEAGARIGLVTGNWCAAKYHLRVEGEQSHTGATLLSDRKDALLAAAHVIAGVREIVERQKPGSALASVGEISVRPNVAGVIAREAELFLDVRSHSIGILDKVRSQVQQLFSGIEERFGLAIRVISEDRRESVEFGRAGVRLAARAAGRLQLQHLELLTMAGHDAVNLAQTVPTVLLFVPSKDGISHNERERSEMPDMWAGTSLLTELVQDLIAGRLHAVEREAGQPERAAAG